MTKQDIVSAISNETGIDKSTVQTCVEAMMRTISASMVSGENVYLRGFGSFILKTRAKKVGRNISKNVELIIPEHKIMAFKPAQTLAEKVK
ncbi:MAG: integration host factor subunit beta [Bacteroidaceae bacterium]|jgi:DNA-binding protein HU-beta|nr:integration host factor subunit beta [Bacteroidaceae bacterium]MDY6249588.1 HU family DNA-binding protein [Bacteroidaceae bacterium]